MFGPLASISVARSLMKIFTVPPPPRAHRVGRGRRTVMSIARAVERARWRNYDIHKIGAKDRARMARAQSR